jgi:murein DD-endopeptidase MepM/ murein hydrolase activator NlpD
VKIFKKQNLLYLYVLLSLFVINLLFVNAYHQHNIIKNINTYNNDLTEENEFLKKNISVIGGLGLDITELDRNTAEELSNKYQEIHSLSNYIWKYKEIGYPINPKNSYVTSEYGLRYINNRRENARSVDMRQIDSLETFASINGICKVGYDKIYGNNIIIEGTIDMENAFGEIEQHSVIIRLSHLSRILIKDKQYVNKGDLIGYIGNSGRCATYNYRERAWKTITEHQRQLGYGVHLDFELIINGYKRNPFATSTFKKTVSL